MLAIKQLISIIFVLLSSVIEPPIIIIDDSELTITGGPYGPFFAYQNDTPIVITLNQSGSHRYNCTFACGPSSSDIRYSTTFSQSFGGSCNLTLNLPTFSYLTPNGMFCRLTCVEKYGNTSKEFLFTIYPAIKNHTINAGSYISSSFNNLYASCSFFSGNLFYATEKFQFPNYIDYLNIDTYYYLDVSSVDFIYTLKTSMPYESAYISFEDSDNLFPYIQHDEEDYISVPLKIIKKGLFSTFEYAKTMYVHPKRLQMSLVPLEGFVATKHFYLPVNHKEDFLDRKIHIEIKNAGVCNTNIIWDLSYLANTNIIGSCSNSDYCVVGGKSNG